MKDLTKKETSIYSILILLSIVAWIGILDKTAYSMNIDSLKETASAFAVIKSVDALMSFTRNLTLIGPIFEPYKEFLDRMSWVMLLSLISLGIQKVMLVALQSVVVNSIVSISVFGIILNKFRKFLSDDLAKKIFKLVVILLVIRFSIPLMTFMITSIESTMHSMESKVSIERIQVLQEKLLHFDNLLEENNKEKMNKQKEIELIRKRISTLENEISEQEKSIDNIINNGKNLFDKVTSVLDTLDAKTQQQVSIRENRIKEINLEIDKLNEHISVIDPSFDFANLNIKIKRALSNLQGLMEDMFDIFLTSVVLFFFKNILFPILFLWALVRLTDNAFNSSNIDYIQDIVDNKIMKNNNYLTKEE